MYLHITSTVVSTSYGNTGGDGSDREALLICCYMVNIHFQSCGSPDPPSLRVCLLAVMLETCLANISMQMCGQTLPFHRACPTPAWDTCCSSLRVLGTMEINRIWLNNKISWCCSSIGTTRSQDMYCNMRYVVVCCADVLVMNCGDGVKMLSLSRPVLYLNMAWVREGKINYFSWGCQVKWPIMDGGQGSAEVVGSSIYVW